jgi:hypothetical protein
MEALDLLALFFACAIVLYAVICFAFWADGYFGRKR